MIGWGWCVAVLAVGWIVGSAGPSRPPHWRVDGEGRGTPAVSGSRVYFLTAHHDVVAASASTGVVSWREATGEPGPDTLGSTVLVSGEVVVVGDHAILGFDAATGTRRWRFAPEEDDGAGGYVGEAAEGVVFVGSRAGRLYALSAATGVPVWSIAVTDAARTTVFQPVVDGDLVVAGFTTFVTPLSGGLVAVERATGRVRWRHALVDGDRPAAGFGGGPVAACGSIWAAGGDGRIRGLDRDTGVSRRELPAVTRGDGTAQERDWRALAAEGCALAAGSLSGVVTMFDVGLGRERWRAVVKDGGSVALRLTMDGDTLYVPHLGGRLVAFAVADGGQRWEIGGLSDGFSWAPAAVGDVAYAAARSGLFALPR